MLWSFQGNNMSCNKLTKTLLKKDLGRDDATQIPRVQQLDVLGSVVVATGSCMPGLDHRLDRATKAFYAERHIFVDKPLSKQFRSAHYVKQIVPVALYSAVQWSFSVANVRRLMTWEAKLLRRMLSTYNVLPNLFVICSIDSAIYLFCSHGSLGSTMQLRFTDHTGTTRWIGCWPR